MGCERQDHVSDATRCRRVGSEVLSIVQHTEALADWVPFAIFSAFWIGSVEVAIGGGLTNAIVVGIVLGVFSPLVICVVMATILHRKRSLRYRQASQWLGGYLSLASPAFLHRYDWSEPFPGALGITALPGGHGSAPEHCLLLMDASTLYQLQPLPANAVVDVVEHQATHSARTGHRFCDSPRVGGMPFGAARFGGRPRSTTPTVRTVILELRYRASRTGPIRTAVIGFGEDLRGAENLRVALADLRMHGHPQPAGSASTRSFL